MKCLNTSWTLYSYWTRSSDSVVIKELLLYLHISVKTEHLDLTLLYMFWKEEVIQQTWKQGKLLCVCYFFLLIHCLHPNGFMQLMLRLNAGGGHMSFSMDFSCVVWPGIWAKLADKVKPYHDKGGKVLGAPMRSMWWTSINPVGQQKGEITRQLWRFYELLLSNFLFSVFLIFFFFSFLMKINIKIGPCKEICYAVSFTAAHLEVWIAFKGNFKTTSEFSACWAFIPLKVKRDDE